MKRWAIGAILMTVGVGGYAHGAALVIETVSTWDHYNYVGDNFIASPDSSRAVGQTFNVVSPYSTLDSFTFFLDDRRGPVPFSAGLVEWSEGAPTGQILFERGDCETTNNHGQGGMEEFRVDTPGIRLTPGKTYLAFLKTRYTDSTVSGNGAVIGLAGNAWVFPPNCDTYAGGNLVHATPSAGDILYVAWESPWWRNPNAQGWDAAFSLSFSESVAPVPEPSVVVLWSSLGLTALTACWRRRRRA